MTQKSDSPALFHQVCAVSVILLDFPWINFLSYQSQIIVFDKFIYEFFQQICLHSEDLFLQYGIVYVELKLPAKGCKKESNNLQLSFFVFQRNPCKQALSALQ